MKSEKAKMEFTKNELESVIKSLKKERYELFWRYDSNSIYLMIEKEGLVVELQFVKGGDFLSLIVESLLDIEDERAKNLIIQTNKGLSRLVLPSIIKTSKHIQLEIDYYLLELHEHMQNGNKIAINDTKLTLMQLSGELEKVK